MSFVFNLDRTNTLLLYRVVYTYADYHVDWLFRLSP